MIKFCALYSGSTGNCIFVSDKKTKILIDIGVSTKSVISALGEIDESPNDIDAILITHEHSDHIKGLKVFSKNFDVPVYLKSNVWEKVKQQIGDDVRINARYIDEEESFSIGTMEIKSFAVPHDAVEPVGFSIFSGNKKVTIATDIGHISSTIRANIHGSDLLLIESNHDENILKAGKYPWFLKKRIMSENGHLSNESAGSFIVDMAKLGMENFILGHLSRKNNFPELAFQTTKNYLEESNIKVGHDVNLDVANYKIGNKLIMI